MGKKNAECITVDFAQQCIDSGLSIIPFGQDKTPRIRSWEKYITERATTKELNSWYNNLWKGNKAGLAIICGRVSNYLECIDFDNHNGRIDEIFNKWSDNVCRTNTDLIGKLTIEKTPSGGRHVFYRVQGEVTGNHKLARQTINDGKKDKWDTMIETRGEGGFAIVAPTDGYELLNNDFLSIPVITADEQKLLLDEARKLDEPRKTETTIKAPIEKQTKYFAEAKENYLLTPWDDFNARGDHGSILRANGWKLLYTAKSVEYWQRPRTDNATHPSATFNAPNKGNFENRLFVFSSNADPFEDNKTYTRTQIYTLFKYGTINSDTLSKTKKDLLADGYGVPLKTKKILATDKGKKNARLVAPALITSNPEQFDEYKPVQVDNKENEIKFVEFEAQNGMTYKIEKDIIFWSEKIKVVDAETNEVEGEIVISFDKFYKFLEAKNWGLIKSGEEYVMMILENNIIYLHPTITDLVQFVKNTLARLPYYVTQLCTKEHLEEAFMRIMDKLLKKNLLSMLPAIKTKVLKDTKTISYLFYRNGVLKIEKNKPMELMNYSEINGVVYEDCIIDRDFKIIGDDIPHIPCEIERFFQNVCKSKEQEWDERSEWKLNLPRYKSLLSAIGYLGHRYKSDEITKVVVLGEEKLSTNPDEANGRTGKSLTYKILSKIRNTYAIDGKNFNFDDTFCMQGVTAEQDLLVFDDVQKKFPMEKLFANITDGIRTRKLYKQIEHIPYEDSPKIMVLTNYVNANDTASFKDRKIEIEFSDYYDENHKPSMDFGGMFFDDRWGKPDKFGFTEWEKFDNFLAGTIKYFIENGLQDYEKINLNERKLTALVNEDFLAYAEAFIEVLQNGRKVYSNTLYYSFIAQYPQYGLKQRQEISRSRVTNWFNKMLKYKDIKTDYCRERNSCFASDNMTLIGTFEYYWTLKV